MTDKLPPNLLALFAPRPPLRWVPPADHAPGERKTAPITGIAAFLPALQEYKETDKYIPTERSNPIGKEGAPRKIAERGTTVV
jgi:U1 small nuclear ribonucleoprotein 70kDa